MSEIVEVKIKGTAVTARYGSLSDGDILRTDAAFAKHLVEDCKCADYLTAPEIEQKSDASQPASQPSKSKANAKREN